MKVKDLEAELIFPDSFFEIFGMKRVAEESGNPGDEDGGTNGQAEEA
jgi:hypothetical protein